MPRRRARRTRNRRWNASDERKLIENYDKCTIKELMLLFPDRDKDSINSKIKRLKSVGKIKSVKDKEVIKRSYDQRGKDMFFTVNDS